MISIVIPTYTNSTGLRSCLEPLVKFTDLAETQIIVVANGAPEETRTVCNDYPVKLLWYDEPLGFAKACNAGILASDSEFIVLLNDDVILLDQSINFWIDTLRAPFADEKVGITGPLMNFCPHAQRNFLLFFCVMIRRKLLDEIGLLDTAFTVGGGEDTDLCCKAVDAGWKVLQIPETPVYLADQDDPSLPAYQRQIWIADFPIWHQAGCTVGKIEGFNKVFEANSKILRERYGVDIERAKMVEGWMADSELEWLARQAKTASVVVEIGSWCGRSSRAIADNLPAGSTLFCVDTFSGSSGEPDAHKTAKEREGDAVFMKFYANLYDHIRLGRVIPVRMDSANAAETLAKLEVKADIVFIDADHSGEGVRRDIEAWKPLVKDGGLLCGHDYYLPEQNPEAWIGVRTVVDELFPDAMQAPNTTIWQVRPKLSMIEAIPSSLTVTASISTKDRYHVLPMCISAILNQTHLPDKLVIYDDGEQKDLRELSPFSGLLQLALDKGVQWEVFTTPRKGQVYNHQHCLNVATTDLIWRIDDDEVPEPDCLEKLLYVMKDEEVGAVAGLVHHPGGVTPLPEIVDGSLNDVSLGLNLQWFDWNSGPKETEHLYSSFLFRVRAGREAGGYPINLSSIGHHEESIFSHAIKRAGWKLIVTPFAKTIHLRESTGGIRSYADPSLWEHDEQVWQEYLKAWGVVQPDTKMFVIDAGVGDHWAFRSILPKLREMYQDKKIILAVCYPRVFDGEDVTLISIADAKRILGSKYDDSSVYKWAWEHDRNGPLAETMLAMHAQE